VTDLAGNVIVSGQHAHLGMGTVALIAVAAFAIGRATAPSAEAKSGHMSHRLYETQGTEPTLAASVYYRNCSAARAAGVTPIMAGEPGYARHLDRDGDGIACE
jgi:hypothetical protein